MVLRVDPISAPVSGSPGAAPLPSDGKGSRAHRRSTPGSVFRCGLLGKVCSASVEASEDDDAAVESHTPYGSEVHS